MNILIFSWRDPKHSLAGGAEQVVLEHAKGWVRAGNKVTWFSSKSKDIPEIEKIDQVEIIRGGYQYLGVQIAGFFYYIKNRKDIDLVVDQFHGLPFFTPLYVKKPKIALIQEVAGKVWFLNPLQFPLNMVVGLVGYIFEPLIFLFYRKIPFMTGSESAKKQVVEIGIPAKNITVVPHGVVLSNSRAVWTKQKSPVVTYLGMISKDKGIEEAIKSFALVSKEIVDVSFWVIGKEESKKYFRKIRRLIKKLKLEKSIKLWGRVSDDKRDELLAKSHVLVNPSVHEGWGLVNIEANSYKTPVVAYNSAGLVDSVKNGYSGIICKKNSPDEMAKNVIKLLKNKHLYQKYSMGAYKWSHNFSWDKSRDLSLQLINKVFILK